MLADLRLELVLCDEWHKVIRETGELIWLHRFLTVIVVFVVAPDGLRKLSLELWNEFQKPTLDEVETLCLDICTNAQILAALEQGSSQFHA